MFLFLDLLPFPFEANLCVVQAMLSIEWFDSRIPHKFLPYFEMHKLEATRRIFDFVKDLTLAYCNTELSHVIYTYQVHNLYFVQKKAVSLET